MRIVRFSRVVGLAFVFVGLVTAGPVPKVSRGVMMCANERNVVAGSGSTSRRNLEISKGIDPRTIEPVPEMSNELRSSDIAARTLSLPPMVWCLKPHKTFMQITVTNVLANGQVQQLLLGAAQVTQTQLQRFGPESVLQQVFFYSLTPQLAIRVWNWDDRHMRWSALNTAVAILYNFMANRAFGTATFLIYDMNEGRGAILVGQGEIGPVPR